MTKTTKMQKVIKWAVQKRERSITKASRELGYSNDKAFRFLVNRAIRSGVVKAEFVGRKVRFSLTQNAYYNRSDLVF